MARRESPRAGRRSARTAGAVFSGASRLVASWLAGVVLAVGSAAGDSRPETDPPAHWAPVIVQHQGGGLIESYPVPFGDDGSGEFTVYTWVGSGPEHHWYGYFWQYATGKALAVVVEVERDAGDAAQPAGVLLASAEGCRWRDAGSLRRVRDAVGLHPLVSVRGYSLGVGLGDLAPVLPEAGVIDWTELPLEGRRFPRAWQRQPHLAPGTPGSFGVVLRHEPEGGFQLGQRRGQGNTPHHWNLLAYRMEPLSQDDVRMRVHPARPAEWPCAGIFSDPGRAVARLRASQEGR